MGGTQKPNLPSVRLSIKHASLLILSIGLAQSCVGYTPRPLDNEVKSALTTPDMAQIRIEARQIKHPLLKPIELDMRDGLSADEAAILAVLANLKLRSVRDQRGIASAQVLQAGILPNPQLSYTRDIPTGNAEQGLVPGYGINLNWEVTALISRSAKIAAATSDAASVNLDVAWQEWQTAEAAKLQVLHLYFLDRQLEIAGAEEEGLRQNLDVVRRALDRGFVTTIEVAAAEAALNKTRADVLMKKQQREQERLTLNELLGFPPEVILRLQSQDEISWTKALPPLQEFTDEIEDRRLDLLALKSGYQSQEERLRAAILQQFPKISLGFSRARDTTNVVSTGFGITIDLPLFDRNQGGIALESATRAKLFDEYVARVFEARGEVAHILANIESLRRQREVAERSIPTMQKVVESYGVALRQGNADVVTYYNARAELTAKQLELIDLNHQLDDLRVGLEIASGDYLAQGDKKGAIP